MGVLRFTFGAGLIVASALLLLGAAATSLSLLVGERPQTTGALALVSGYLLLAASCAYAGYRVLRSGVRPRAAQRP